jgi:hypothetical protein
MIAVAAAPAQRMSEPLWAFFGPFFRNAITRSIEQAQRWTWSTQIAITMPETQWPLPEEMAMLTRAEPWRATVIGSARPASFRLNDGVCG